MEKTEKAKEALKIVTDAAGIHCERLSETLQNSKYPKNESFNTARLQFIRKTQAAIREVKALKLDEELKIKERVDGLSLEESVDLLIAVENHIRDLRRFEITEFQ